jgi:hypothetical protein
MKRVSKTGESVKSVPPKSSWRDHIKVHPAADLFPMMSDDELKILGEDIKKNGMELPLIFYQDKPGDEYELLDGRNRLDALEVVGEPVFNDEGFDDNSRYNPLKLHWHLDYEYKDSSICEDPYAFVISANLRRRHLDNEGKRKLIANVVIAMPERSNLQIAKMLGVDDKTVAVVRRELEARSDIPITETRTDTKGRRQQAHKPRVTSVPNPVMLPDPAPITPHTPTKMVPAEMVPSAPKQSAASTNDADQIDELTSEQQDGVLHLMLKLLASVDHKHRKKFHKHFTEHSFDGIYISSCGNRGWASGSYVIDPAVEEPSDKVTQIVEIRRIIVSPREVEIDEQGNGTVVSEGRYSNGEPLEPAAADPAQYRAAADEACAKRDMAREQPLDPLSLARSRLDRMRGIH